MSAAGIYYGKFTIVGNTDSLAQHIYGCIKCLGHLWYPICLMIILLYMLRVEEQIGAFPRMTSTCVLKAVSFYFDILSLNERREHSSIQTCLTTFILLYLALSISPSLSLFPQTGTLCSSVSLEVCKSWALQPNISPLWSVRGPICSPPPPPLLFLHVITPFSPDRGHKLAPFTLHFPQLHCF